MTDDKERIAELTEQLETARNSQAGSDRAVKKLQNEIEDLREQLESKAETDKAKQTEAEMKATIAERESVVAIREKALNLALDRGVDIKTAFAALGLGDGDVEDQFEALDAIRQAERDDVLKSGGRHPYQNVKMRQTPLTIAEINRLPDHELKALPPEVTNAALDAAMDDEKKRRKSLRGQLSRSYSGGE